MIYHGIQYKDMMLQKNWSSANINIEAELYDRKQNGQQKQQFDKLQTLDRWKLNTSKLAQCSNRNTTKPKSKIWIILTEIKFAWNQYSIW